MKGEKGTVCVTGGAGYLASWLIMRLLQKGYSVHATVRADPKYKEDASHLLNLPEASSKLKIFDVELERPESFESAIDGCVGVFHLSQPVDFEGKISVDTIIKITKEGIQGVLQACLKSKTVKKVVYTSSIAAAIPVNKDAALEEIKEIDESVWSDVDLIRSFGDANGVSYIASKTLTERAALDFSKEHGLCVVSILPSAVVGPFITSSLPISFPITLPLIFGNEEGCMMMKTAHWVHIDDVASAHIFLFETPKADGRYICSRHDVTLQQIAKLLSVKYSQYLIPIDFLIKLEEENPSHLSSKKLMDLGFEFKYGLEEMIEGALESCKEKKLL